MDDQGADRSDDCRGIHRLEPGGGVWLPGRYDLRAKLARNAINHAPWGLFSGGVVMGFVSKMRKLPVVSTGVVNLSRGFVRSSVLLVALLSLCGCTPYHKFYSGPDRPEGELALVTGRCHWNGDRVFLEKVDEEDRSIRGSAWDGSYQVALLPGPHTLYVTCRSEYPVAQSIQGAYLAGNQTVTSTHAVSGLIPVEFVAQAGHVYEPKADLESQTWRVWVEDITSKAN